MGKTGQGLASRNGAAAPRWGRGAVGEMLGTSVPFSLTASIYSHFSFGVSQPGTGIFREPSSPSSSQRTSNCSSSHPPGDLWGQGQRQSLTSQVPSRGVTCEVPRLPQCYNTTFQHPPEATPLPEAPPPPLTCAAVGLGPFPPWLGSPLGRLHLEPGASLELRSGDEGE